MAEAEAMRTPGQSGFAIAAAKGLYKLMAYKDEYEVARLYGSAEFKAALEEQFSAHDRLEFHLAPPLLARKDKVSGEPRKMTFGPWMLRVFGWLARAKGLRGSAWDVFGYTAERRLERRMIGDYERLLGEVAAGLTPANHSVGVQLAALALDVKGFGHVKLRNYELARQREAALLAEFRNPTPVPALRAAE
jgi:indolepyruvate ferredoxin oxidoreductase